MNEFRYERPQTIAEGVALLARPGARALAGGSDLIPQLREGRRQASVVVDLKHIDALTRIEARGDGGWRVGAAASVAAMRRHTAFFAAHRGLVESAGLIGSLQVQSRATLGGNLCNAAPSADAVPLLIACDAEAEIHGPQGVRRVAVESVPTGPGRTALAPGELVAALHLPPPAARTAARYLRFTPRREMDIAIAGVGVRLDLDVDDTVAAARIVLASVGPTPIRARQAEATLVGARGSAAAFAAAAAAAAAAATPISDTRGSAAYRRHLIGVLTARALSDVAQRLGVALA